MSPQAARVQTSAEKQIARANALEKQRGELMKQIASNREYLRLMAENEELDAEQEEWLDDFYPQKEKGSSRSTAEVEATRKVKAAARNGATTVAEARAVDAPTDDDDDDE